MPSDRGNTAHVLPRWMSDPVASDFAGPDRLALEAQAGGGLTGWLRPMERFMWALGLVYGTDQDPYRLTRPPRWPGNWAPWKDPYDPSTYETLPGGPPDEIRRGVEAQQARVDEQMRKALEKNAAGRPIADKLREMGIPPRQLLLSAALRPGLS